MATTVPDFAKLVPGFDFLQDLVKNAGSVLPSIGQWVAPTLNPQELEKRIDELRTVQFWLEQNARMLGATIQALEVQRMTLSTLQTMNVQVADLRESLRIRLPSETADEDPDERDDDTAASTPAPAARAVSSSWPLPPPIEPPAAAPAPRKRPAARSKSGPSSGTATPPAGVVDPMQWWGALTKQFTQLAATAMKDAASDSAKQLAGGLVKQGFNAAEQTFKAGMAPALKAAGVAGGVANNVARSAARAKSARKARGGAASAAAKPAAAAGKKTAASGPARGPARTR